MQAAHVAHAPAFHSSCTHTHTRRPQMGEMKGTMGASAMSELLGTSGPGSGGSAAAANGNGNNLVQVVDAEGKVRVCVLRGGGMCEVACGEGSRWARRAKDPV